MANTSTTETKQGFVFTDISFFPAVINGRINVTKFLSAVADLLGLIGIYFGAVFQLCYKSSNGFCTMNSVASRFYSIYRARLPKQIPEINRFGKVFAPVKYDIQGNVDKIKKYFKYNEESCLLELMLEEKSKGENFGTESILWLNRALLFFELVFHEILSSLESNNSNINMKDVFRVAYEGSVKKYHNWITQQLFTVICKMSPTFPQIVKSLEVENEIEAFKTKLTNFNVTLHLVRCKIDDFISDNNLDL